MDRDLSSLEAVEVEGSDERTQHVQEELMSSLPRAKGWITDHFYEYQDFWYDMHFLRGVIWAQQHFEARPSDILLATFPKTGLTWLKALTYSILNRERDGFEHAFAVKNPHECVPYIEFHAYEKDPVSSLGSMPSPRLLSTHLPYGSLPETVHRSGCKIVCIVRDPKDVFVSMMSFVGRLTLMNSPPVSWYEAFESFCEGVSLVGPFWDHILGYWKASLEHPKNVLVVKYEDLKRDTSEQVRRLADFLGRPFSSEEIEKGILCNIVYTCSIDNLKNMDANKCGVFHFGALSSASVEKSAYFRRGEVGDWKNHLSVEMAERLDEITKRKLDSHGLTF
ncbi:hypothetical protein MLD38_015303 [Melastoma candidum]|uniref:Uncharacterized protein n=1 Tax=Melastoma candidum TaxID=119954 RepID=A0ACB9RJD2_9MYRT|nr:hypothetical protein MLD38_015303 [Melastoma candidum]